VDEGEEIFWRKRLRAERSKQGFFFVLFGPMERLLSLLALFALSRHLLTLQVEACDIALRQHRKERPRLAGSLVAKNALLFSFRLN
jgi:hypothetical protein